MVKREIDKIKKVLVELLRDAGISVDKIVLFGSYAKGKIKKDSDIDIIVVSKDFRNKNIFDIAHLTKDIHWKLVEKLMKPFDIIYYSDIEWNKGHSIIINAAKKNGEVIYK